ncbi:MAG: hypothetical protein MUC58_06035 [Rhizobiaceae bacterium]|jgi:hypothetical protein|nr:hypothetical protein [Rhizobiaceae bacterium]
MTDSQRPVDRAIALVTAETLALKTGQPVDLHANADAKARLLLELSSARNASDAPGLKPEDVNRLMAALAENARTLERHMEAVNALAGSLADAMRAMDDDGTYGRHGQRRSA